MCMLQHCGVVYRSSAAKQLLPGKDCLRDNARQNAMVNDHTSAVNSVDSSMSMLTVSSESAVGTASDHEPSLQIHT